MASELTTKPAIMDYKPSKLFAQLSSDLQERIQAIKLPPSLPEPVEVLFPSYLQERVQAISLPPELEPLDAAQGWAAKQPFDMPLDKQPLTRESEVPQIQEAKQSSERQHAC